MGTSWTRHTQANDAFNSVQSIRVVHSGYNILIVHNATDLQVAELTGLLSNSLEVAEVVGQVEVHDFLSEVILCPCLCDFQHWHCG